MIQSKINWDWIHTDSNRRSTLLAFCLIPDWHVQNVISTRPKEILKGLVVSKAYVLVTRGSEELSANICRNTDEKLFICSKQPYGHRAIYRDIVIGAEDTCTAELIATYLRQKAGISPEDCEDFQIFEAKSQNELTTEEIALTLELEGPKSQRECPEWLQELRELAKKAKKRVRRFLNTMSQKHQKKTAPNPEITEHSEDFTSVIWFGTNYEFNKTQAKCVEILWKEWEKGKLSLSEKTIGEEIGSSDENYKLKNTFRTKKRNKAGGYIMHPAWGKMIVPADTGKGIFKLSSKINK